MKEKLQEIFRDVFDDDTIEIKREMTADAIDGWDSLTHFQLIMEIEMNFDIKFTTEEITYLKTVGQLMDIIEKHVGERK